MEKITSRKNEYIRHLRLLSSDRAYRSEQGEYICDGVKLLREALEHGADVRSVLWKEREQELAGLNCEKQYIAAPELFDYASPMMSSPGPLFAVAQPEWSFEEKVNRLIALENVQDPGNVGTVLRSANAFGVDAVVLVGDCADLYNPKTVRSTMGAIFRQKTVRMERDELIAFIRENELLLYGAALREDAVDIRKADLSCAAVAIGSEGRGLSGELLKLCDSSIIIPMQPESESLNAAVAASLVMWEMAR